VKQPNVAVITLKDEECLQNSDSGVKKQKKSVPKKKERVNLEKQVHRKMVSYHLFLTAVKEWKDKFREREWKKLGIMLEGR
jgi:hypothetical protein